MKYVVTVHRLEVYRCEVEAADPKEAEQKSVNADDEFVETLWTETASIVPASDERNSVAPGEVGLTARGGYADEAATAPAGKPAPLSPMRTNRDKETNG